MKSQNTWSLCRKSSKFDLFQTDQKNLTGFWQIKGITTTMKIFRCELCDKSTTIDVRNLKSNPNDTQINLYFSIKGPDNVTNVAIYI